MTDEPTQSEIAKSVEGSLKRRRRKRWAAAFVIGAVIALWIMAQSGREQFPDGITDADVVQARSRFIEQFGFEPDHGDTLAMLGEQLIVAELDAVAMRCYAAISESHPRFGLSAQLQTGILLAERNEAAEAERVLRKYLQNAAGSRAGSVDGRIRARKWLTYLLSVQLRLEERHAIHTESHADGLADLQDSLQYHFPHLLLYRTNRGAERLRQYLEVDPDSRAMQVALGRYLTGEGRLDEAEGLLRELHGRQPGDPRSAAALLECLYEQDDWDGFADVIDDLPADAAQEPWLLTDMRGRFSLHREQWDDARREFLRVLSVIPSHSSCQMGLVTALRSLGDDQALKVAEQRSLVLARIRVSMPRVQSGDPEELQALAELCDEAQLSDAAVTFRSYSRAFASPDDARDPQGTSHE